ncbi:MAG: hypothetical protein ACSHWW_11015 [Nonlabens sp.]|uniref:hypothetical protein n=1 Tax=Nonlabens sp. TaxID=1888209 RepID=UPI003EF50F74
MKKADILNEARLALCSIMTGRLQSIFLFALILFIIPIVLFTTASEIDYKIILGSLVSFGFGLWLIRSKLRDYKEEYRREAIREEQREKGLRE